MKEEEHKLNIYLVVPGMPFDGDTLKERSLGGSETAGLCVGRELHQLGHDVTMMCNLPHGEKVVDGVSYVDIQRADEIIQKVPHDVLIVQREPRWFGYSTASKLNILWNHDLGTKGFSGAHQMATWNIDWVFLLSQFHIDQVKSVYTFLHDDHIRQTRNGIDLEDFPKHRSGMKTVGKVMYAARPERGLINLVGQNGIMERLLKVDPKIHLYVAGYDNTTPQMAQFYHFLWGRCEELPNVTNLGCLTKKDLYRHYSESEAYVYPTSFEEISCITAMECMATGTPFVTTNVGALPETLGDKTSVVLEGETDFRIDRMWREPELQRFTDEVVGLLKDKPRLKKLRFQCRERAKKFSWSGVAEQWSGLFFEEFRKKTEDKEKLVSHFLYHDDVVMAKRVAEVEKQEATLKVIEDMRPWIKDKETHKNHYEAFAAEEFKDRTEERHCLHYDQVFQAEERWKVTQVWLKENIEDRGRNPKDVTILDVGCGAGYFSVGMANLGYNVTGIDPATTYLEWAEVLAKHRLKEETGTVQFSRGDAWQLQQYDVIYIAEVMEHVADPVDLVRTYEPYLKEGGRFVMTTPFGPTRRASKKRSGHHHDLHVHHFEHADLEDMFGKKEEFRVEILYWQHTGSTRELLGWYLFSFGQGGEFGYIDFYRKITVQNPRDRLSVCMIVKDEESILRRCLDSVEEAADEIVVLDTGSSDRTMEIAKEYGAIVFEGGSDPLQCGFERPRNESISQARGEWILWIDADEELQGAENLRKYLRDSVYRGFRVRQHHFACQPVGMPAIVDKPVRIFRRDEKIRFFGLIHEHPGVNPNDGVGEVIEVADVDISHGGYLIEPERRKKFWRNLPWMMRDMEKYPDRILTKWLYMRDLIHLAKWSVEQTGSLGEAGKAKLREAIQIYRNTFLSGGGHMMEDGLQYYAEACRMLGIGQVFTWSVGINQQQIEQPRSAIFTDRDDFQAFLRKNLDEKSWQFEGKYR